MNQQSTLHERLAHVADIREVGKRWATVFAKTEGMKTQEFLDWVKEWNNTGPHPILHGLAISYIVSPDWLSSGIGNVDIGSQDLREFLNGIQTEKGEQGTAKTSHEGFMAGDPDMQDEPGDELEVALGKLDDIEKEELLDVLLNKHFVKVSGAFYFDNKCIGVDLEGAGQEEKTIDGYIYAPYFGANPHVYALRVTGDGLSPRYKSGEFLLVEAMRMDNGRSRLMLTPGCEVLADMPDHATLDGLERVMLGEVTFSGANITAANMTFKKNKSKEVFLDCENIFIRKIIGKMCKSTFFLPYVDRDLCPEEWRNVYRQVMSYILETEKMDLDEFVEFSDYEELLFP